MKRGIACLFLLFSSIQFVNAQRTPFMRVYNSSGKKLSKGFLFDSTDTSLILSKGNSGKKFMETPVTNIELIKTKRTISRRIVNTTLSVVGFVVVITATIASSGQNGRNYNRSGRNNSDRNSEPDKISTPPKPLNRYVVKSDPETWQKQRVLLHRLL